MSSSIKGRRSVNSEQTTARLSDATGIRTRGETGL